MKKTLEASLKRDVKEKEKEKNKKERDLSPKKIK
jgi:hypothetical protein